MYALYFFIILIAASLGSFLNVLIYRLPIMLKNSWIRDCQAYLHIAAAESPSINLYFPRSFCPHCKTTIKARHNIPLWSFFWLKGRCHYCQEPLSLRYPLVEACSVFFACATMAFFGITLQALLAFCFLWILLALFFIDLDHQLLPQSLTISLLWLGLLGNTQEYFTTLTDAVITTLVSYLLLWLFARLFYLCTGKVGMGNGDFVLFAAFGAWFGITKLPFILLFSSLSGALIGSLYLLYQKKPKDTPIPFGPFLCAAGSIALFFGDPFYQWFS